MPARPPPLAIPVRPRRFELPTDHQVKSELLGAPPRRRSPSTRKRMAQRQTLTAECFLMGAAEAPTSDYKADLSPKAREGSFDTTCPLTPRKLSLPELSPEAPSVPAATATDILELVPRYFEYDTVTDEYKIYWKFAGALDHRFFARQGPVDVSCHDVPHGKHDDIPMDVSAVVTRLVKPLIYPIGCPKITRKLLGTPENKRTPMA